jgi:acetoacetyl-CoA synthetase
VRDKEDGKVAITEVREGGAGGVRSVTYGELRERVGEMAKAMRARGVGRGDRVVIVGANSVETVVVWLAAGWVGAVFSSSSTDMGVKGILQRAVQVNPKVSFLFLFLFSPSLGGRRSWSVLILMLRAVAIHG